MEYQVPQFIEAEDKIIGPLTFKQFLYVAGAAGLCVVFFVYLNIIVAILLSILAGGLGAALAFYKVNGKPFIEVLEAGFNYLTRAKLFLWKHKVAEDSSLNKVVEVAKKPLRATPRLTRDKLPELAWSLDIKSAEEVRTRP